MHLPFFSKKSNSHIKIAICVLILLLVVMIFIHIGNPINLHNLQNKYEWLINLHKDQPLLFTLGFFLVYIVSIFFVIPDSTILSILAGSIYPLPVAVTFISLCETIGSLLYFCVIRYVCTEYYKKKTIRLRNSKLGIHYSNNKKYYLLFLRISHVLPFWVVSVLAAGLKTRASIFVWTTFIGTLPLSYILAQAGQNLQKILISNEPFSLQKIINTPIELMLIGIGAIALIPVGLKRYLKKR